MPENTANTSARVRVTSKDGLDLALQHIGNLQHELETLSLDLAKRTLPHTTAIRQIQEEVQPRISALEQEINDLVDQAAAYATKHRQYLFGDGNAAELVHGAIKIQANPPRCVIDPEAADHIMETLRRMDLADLIRTKVTIDLQGMKRHRETVEQIKGVQFVQEERLILSPALSGTPFAVPLSQD